MFVQSTDFEFHRYVVRDFTYDEQAIEKAKVDLAALEVHEKELWVSGLHLTHTCPFTDPRWTQTDLLRLSRINFSEAFQVLVHLKVVRAFVESVLRYGLPANYFAVFIKVSLSSFVHVVAF